MMTTIKTIICRPRAITTLFVACGMCWSAAAADMGGRGGPVSFKNDVVPVFMRGGCNGGACHGAGTGKDGFRLSLFGYDPEGDYYRIVEEYVGRRINLAVPEKSLLLEKAAGRVPHTGGEIFKPESDYYQTLLAWIEQGAPQDPPDTPEPLRLELTPEKLTFTGSGEQQAEVIAHYSDGSRRNVANLAVYLASNDAIASIDETALIRGNKPGAAHVFARFNRFTVGAEVVVIPSGDFSFPDIEPQNYIDELVFARLKELRIEPSGLCSDEEFLRRVTLDITGRLPTPDERQRFLGQSGGNAVRPQKRRALVEDLLLRESCGELWAAKWGEWLRIRTNTNPEKGTARKAGWNYAVWLREQLVAGVPWDVIAHSLLTGTGSNFRNPASNFYTMLPQGKLEPKKLGEDTAQVFLGLRTQCAQCHNHPFDRWTMDDYYSFTSFFTGVRRKHGTEAREYYTYVDLEAEPAKHPVDDRPMPAAFLGGGVADVVEQDPRRVLADWMVDPANELFRRNLANRIWDHFFGRGIIEPVDDVRISNPASNEALLEELGRRLAEDHQFDARKLMHDICLSATYQLSMATTPSNVADESQFSHARLRRLRADVLFDCINQALDYTPRMRRTTADRAVAMFEGGGYGDDYNSYFFSTFGQAKRESVCVCETVLSPTISQTLHMVVGDTVTRAISHRGNAIDQLMDRSRNAEEVIQGLFVRILGRQPTREESAAVLAADPKSPDRKVERQYLGNVAWALLNSDEFLFNH